MSNNEDFFNARKTLKELDFNPVKELILLAESVDTSPQQKISICKELIRVSYPKLKAENAPSETFVPSIIKLVAAVPEDVRKECELTGFSNV